MSRFAKQLTYGALYATLAVLIFIALIPGVVPGAGPSNIPEDIQNLETRGAVTVMTAADGNVAFFGKVYNPNQRYTASSFSYFFSVVRDGVAVLETPQRNAFVYPRTEAPLLEVVVLPTLMPTFSSTRDGFAVGAEDTEIVLNIGVADWVSADFTLLPVLAIARSEISSDENGALVRGEVQNTGTVTATVVRIIAIMKDMRNFPLFAAQTVLANVPGGASQNFFIRFPRDPGIVTHAVPENTELIIEAQ